jgi:predicted MFS family arabinose efflux permease
LLGDANAARGLLFIAATVLGHFTIIPLLSPHLVLDLGFPERDLFLAYFIGGVLTVFTAPYIGKLADSLGRFRVFTGLVVMASFVTLVITHTGPVPVWVVLALCGLFFVFASGRFVPAQAIMTLAVPASRRGAFMSLSGVARDLAMGLSATLGAWLVTKTPSGGLEHFEWLGWVAAASGLVSVWLGSRVRVNEPASPISGQAELAALRIDSPQEPGASEFDQPNLAQN